MPASEQHELAAFLLRPGNRVLDEVDPFLRHQAGDAHHQRLVRVHVQAEAHLHVLFAQRLALHRSRLEIRGEKVVQPRVPNLGVHAVDHPRELRALLRQRLTQETRAAAERLTRVRRGYRGDVVGVHDGTLHEAQPLRVVPDGPFVHGAFQRVELASRDPGRHELLLPALAGVVHVVDRQHDLGVVQKALVVVDVPVEHGHRAALPLVHVNYVGIPPRHLQALQGRAAEREVRLRLVVRPAVDLLTDEEVRSLAKRGAEAYDRAPSDFPAVHRPLKVGHSNLLLAVPLPLLTLRHVKVHHVLNILDLTLKRRVVRDAHLDVVALAQVRPRQAGDDVAQASHFRHRRHLRGDVHDVQRHGGDLARLRVQVLRHADRRAFPEGRVLVWLRPFNGRFVGEGE